MGFLLDSLIHTFLQVNTIPIIGTYTLHRRPGLYSQIIKTLRYDKKNKGWINNIGLKNEGIIKGIEEYYSIKKINKDVVLSIGFINLEDISLINYLLPDDIDIEINIGCPNVTKFHICDMLDYHLEKFLPTDKRNTIIKIPHNVSMKEIDRLYNVGFKKFHCSNTMPIEKGALSGQILINKNIKTIKEMYERYCGEIEIIGGGGIVSNKEIQKYCDAGVDHVSISSVCLNPLSAMLLHV